MTLVKRVGTWKITQHELGYYVLLEVTTVHLTLGQSKWGYTVSVISVFGCTASCTRI